MAFSIRLTEDERNLAESLFPLSGRKQKQQSVRDDIGHIQLIIQAGRLLGNGAVIHGRAFFARDCEEDFAGNAVRVCRIHISEAAGHPYPDIR